MITLDERKSKSFDVVLDAVKLLITLSTAVIGYLASQILVRGADNSGLEVLRKHSCGISWSLALLSGCVFFAILTILKITGILGNEKLIPNDKVSIYDSFTQICFAICLFLFFIAIIIIGVIALNEL